MPRKPRPMPASRPGVIRSSWMKLAAMTRVKNGAVDWRIPARPEAMCCSAHADEPERDRDVDGAQDGEVPDRPGVARERRPRDRHDHEEDREADEDAQQDQAERRQRLDADLDEEVAAAPHQGERAEQDGVAGGRARRIGGARPEAGRSGVGGHRRSLPRPAAWRGPGRPAPPIPVPWRAHASPARRLPAQRSSPRRLLPLHLRDPGRSRRAAGADRPRHGRVVGRLLAGRARLGPHRRRDPGAPPRPGRLGPGGGGLRAPGRGARPARRRRPRPRRLQPLRERLGPARRRAGGQRDHGPRPRVRAGSASSPRSASASSRPWPGFLYNTTGYGPSFVLCALLAVLLALAAVPGAGPRPRGPRGRRARPHPRRLVRGRPADPAPPAARCSWPSSWSTSGSSPGSPTCPSA